MNDDSELKNEIDKEMMRRSTVLDDKIRKICGKKKEDDKLLLIAVTRKVKKEFSDNKRTMKKTMKDNEKKTKKNAENESKRELKEEKKKQKNAEIALKQQLKNEKKGKKVEENVEEKNELQLKNKTGDKSIVMDYLQRIIIENNINEKKLFEGLKEKRNVLIVTSQK